MLTASLERSALEADQRQQDGAASKTASSKKQGQASKDKDGVDHQATIGRKLAAMAALAAD